MTDTELHTANCELEGNTIPLENKWQEISEL